ncbi:MAG TPA: cupin domain-containing protein [Candidatus Acidoferrales bacterium]|nr:cupin domain-containing protein [Candidatus Acidoferrales bacterium]
MKHIREYEVKGVRASAPYARTLKHLIAPWTVPGERMSVTMAKVDLGSRSNPHSHAEQEEMFFVISGRGWIEVGEERERVEAGSVVLVPPGVTHSLVNEADETFKVLSVVSPPFDKDDFAKQHLLADTADGKG